jgi:hypothetical protein
LIVFFLAPKAVKLEIGKGRSSSRNFRSGMTLLQKEIGSMFIKISPNLSIIQKYL